MIFLSTRITVDCNQPRVISHQKISHPENLTIRGVKSKKFKKGYSKLESGLKNISELKIYFRNLAKHQFDDTNVLIITILFVNAVLHKNKATHFGGMLRIRSLSSYLPSDKKPASQIWALDFLYNKETSSIWEGRQRLLLCYRRLDSEE